MSGYPPGAFSNASALQASIAEAHGQGGAAAGAGEGAHGPASVAGTGSVAGEEDEDFDAEAALEAYYTSTLQFVDEMPIGTEQDYKNHNDLPLARIKRIMKSDEDVRMISAEAPVLFAKACELLITELSLRAWKYSVNEKSRRRTLQREDIQQAAQDTDIFDFLREVIGAPGEFKGHAGALALQALQSQGSHSKRSDSGRSGGGHARSGGGGGGSAYAPPASAGTGGGRGGRSGATRMSTRPRAPRRRPADEVEDDEEYD